MTLASPANTLRFHQARALTTKRDMRSVRLATVIGSLNTMLDAETELVRPEREALWFYGMNHGMALLRQAVDPLEALRPDDLAFVRTYHERLGFTAKKAFYYLLVTCTREARHCHNSPGSIPLAVTDLQGGEPIGEVVDAMNWLLTTYSGEDGIYGALRTKPPKVGVGSFARALSIVFRKGKWSSSYGGPAWANISDCLCSFVEGVYSAEMMLDTVWTLEHNTSNVFNKGVIFNVFTALLSKILDVQRSGQVPELILAGLAPAYGDAQLTAHMQWLRDRFSGAIGRYVDWYKVAALGALGSYVTEQQVQIKQYGSSKWMDEQAKLAAAAELEKLKAAEQHAKDWFTVMPGLEVKFKTLLRAA